MFLKLNRTRLGQLLLRFPKDFVIEGQKASGKVLRSFSEEVVLRVFF